MSRFVAYESDWTDKNGVGHHTFDIWDDNLKWNWNLVKDYKFEGMSYPTTCKMPAGPDKLAQAKA